MKLDIEQTLLLARLGLGAAAIETVVKAARAHKRITKRYCNMADVPAGATVNEVIHRIGVPVCA